LKSESSLDNLTEKAVMEAVQALGYQKTIVMIAHRLSTVRRCDVIFLLEGGRVVAKGRYDELLGTGAVPGAARGDRVTGRAANLPPPPRRTGEGRRCRR
jgi:ABC-type protease/lipase transport system fused ATPase/permease subunit